MRVRTWTGIDAGLDNESQTAFEDGDQKLGAQLIEIRDSGARQIPGDKWPPDNQIVAVTFTRTQWRYALDEARSSLPVYKRLGDAESAELCRQAISVIDPFFD
jgi:hypothetical protein